MEKVESLLSMSSFEALYTLLEYREKYPGYPDHELIHMLRRYPDKSSLDYHNAKLLEKKISLDHKINISASLRNVLKQIIIDYRPTWMYAITFGRSEVMNSLEDMLNLKQCFKSAQLLEGEPSFEVIEWWDELSQLIRAEKDNKKVQQGREGEKLSFEYEKKRLAELGIKQMPKWMALEDNTLGYDIKSFDLGEYGPINKLIEVKSCSSDNMIIFLTRNEWNKALEYKQNYVFHIWFLPTQTLEFELAVSDIEPFILENTESIKWTTLEISLKKLKKYFN